MMSKKELIARLVDELTSDELTELAFFFPEIGIELISKYDFENLIARKRKAEELVHIISCGENIEYEIMLDRIYDRVDMGEVTTKEMQDYVEDYLVNPDSDWIVPDIRKAIELAMKKLDHAADC